MPVHSRLLRAVVDFGASGADLHEDPDVQRRVKITNWLGLSIGVLCIPYVPLFWVLGLKTLALVVIPIAMVDFSIPVLNRVGRFTAARALYFTNLAVAVFTYSAFLGESSGIHYLYFSGVCMPALVASLDEKKLMAYGLAAPMGAYALLVATHFEPFGPALIDPAAQWWVGVSMIPTTLIALMTGMFYFASLNRKAQSRLDRRNGELQLVLDSVDQGLLSIDRDTRVGVERSAAVDTLLGPITPGDRFPDVLRAHDSTLAEWWELAWEGLLDGFMPIELVLTQFPSRLTVGDQHLSLSYKPITQGASEDWSRMMIIVSDISQEVERERAEAAQRETMAIFVRLMRDREGVEQFLSESASLVAAICNESARDEAVQKRRIHTLKGNSALYGLDTISRCCHDLETRLEDRGGLPDASDRTELRGVWDQLQAQLAPLLGTEESDHLTVEHGDYTSLVDALRSGVPRADVLDTLVSWTQTPTHRILGRVQDQAAGLAERLGKAPVEIAVESNGIRIPEETWAPFWSAFVHAVRNSIDHGLEAPEERASKGPGRLSLRTETRGDCFVISIGDDGRGIDWDKIRAKAQGAGLPAESRDDLIAALFSDGVSSRDAVSETSGRGVGMSALRDATRSLGGHITVESQRGHGTTFSFVFPAERLRRAA